MDARVIAALAKWPDVPAVFGWLQLTARGEWRIQGEPIGNEAIRSFIARNYTHDAEGRWLFQNGPQRVYVTLEIAPWVYRDDGREGLITHTGRVPTELRAAAVLEDGRLILETELGVGNIDDRDTHRLLSALVDVHGRALDDAALEHWHAEGGDVFVSAPELSLQGAIVRVRPLRFAQLPTRFGYVRDPTQPA
jgi:hypothetical protein